MDLQLPPAPTVLATVYGTVTDGTNPVPGATVKLFDSAGMPYQHTVTDLAGSYTLSGIPAGTYSIGAVSSDSRLSSLTGVTLSNGATARMDIVCEPDSTLALGVVAGVLTVAGGSEPLAGAKITLSGPLGVTAVTCTASDGEFAFYDLADGVYTLMASAEGYVTSAPMTAVIINGSFANVVMSMALDPRTNSGTVSGFISNSAGGAVAGCFVGLYKVITEAGGAKKEVLTAVTKTNGDGKYLFGGVAGGEYVVKAKLNQ